jgi:hypothetical protein
MESIKAIVVFLVFVLVAVMAGAWLFGYAFRASTQPRLTPEEVAASLAEAPCQPVLPGGSVNPHYQNAWKSCKEACAGAWFHADRFPLLDRRTCECSCTAP